MLVPALVGEEWDAEHGDAARADESVLFGELMHTVTPLPGARAFLELLKTRGHAVVLSSSAREDELNTYLDLLGARDLVDAWTTSADVERTKPHPDVIKAGLEKLGNPKIASWWATRSKRPAAHAAKLPTITLLTGGSAPPSWRPRAPPWLRRPTSLLPRSTTRRWPRDARRPSSSCSPGAPATGWSCSPTTARSRPSRSRAAPADRLPAVNCQNAGLADVWVSQQYNPVSLSDHLANGRPWDLDRTDGRPADPAAAAGHDARRLPVRDRGRAVAQRADDPRVRAEALVVLSADAVYKLDYGALVEEHREAGAAVTMVTTEVDPDDAGRYGVVQVERRPGPRLRLQAGGARRPTLICNEVFVFDPGRVLDRVDEPRGGQRRAGGSRRRPAARAGRAGDVREHRFERLLAGRRNDRRLLVGAHGAARRPAADRPRRPGWPILTQAIGRRAAARAPTGAEIAAGCSGPARRVAARVERWVMGRGTGSIPARPRRRRWSSPARW